MLFTHLVTSGILLFVTISLNGGLSSKYPEGPVGLGILFLFLMILGVIEVVVLFLLLKSHGEASGATVETAMTSALGILLTLIAFSMVIHLTLELGLIPSYGEFTTLIAIELLVLFTGLLPIVLGSALLNHRLLGTLIIGAIISSAVLGYFLQRKSQGKIAIYEDAFLWTIAYGAMPGYPILTVDGKFTLNDGAVDISTRLYVHSTQWGSVYTSEQNEINDFLPQHIRLRWHSFTENQDFLLDVDFPSESTTERLKSGDLKSIAAKPFLIFLDFAPQGEVLCWIYYQGEKKELARFTAQPTTIPLEAFDPPDHIKSREEYLKVYRDL